MKGSIDFYIKFVYNPCF